MLYHAVITELSDELRSEIEQVEWFDGIPQRLTYPTIQPLLTKERERRKGER